MTSSGSGPKLIISIDIGTTYSAASFCIVDDAKDKKFVDVTSWPKQAIADAKIPSVLYYDENLVLRLCGAETEDEDALADAEENNWQRVRWWKIALKPDYIDVPIKFSHKRLPRGLSVEKIFEDFFAYIKTHVRGFIVKSYGTGEQYWESSKRSMVVVLTTPNGWDGVSQNRMRTAAIRAGLVDGNGGHRIKFVSEGEAAIHYALDSGNFKEWIKVGSRPLVCDVGGGTVDISTYKIAETQPLLLQELTSAKCEVAGGIFVNEKVEEFMKAKLKGTRWDNDESITAAMRNFEMGAKRTFDGTSLFTHIRLDGSQSDERHDVSRGKFKISREDMFSFFRPCVTKIIGGLQDALKEGGAIDKLIVVGGFANSPYIFSQLESWGKLRKISVRKPDGLLSKAIAHGGLSWHLRSVVNAKVAKFHYGAEINVKHDPRDPEMIGKEYFLDATGEKRVRYAWHEIVPKDTVMKIGDVRTTAIHEEFCENETKVAKMGLYAYRYVTPPAFIKKDDRLQNGFIHLGNLTADLTACYKAARFSKSMQPGSKRHKVLDYEICLSFYDTEIKAYLKWKEKGKEKTADINVIYDV